MQRIGLAPDFVFGVRFADGSRRCFFVEIDRGTMPITRSNISQTSFQRKMRAYLAVYASRLHERQFGWKAFRVLTVTTDEARVRSMIDAAHNVAHAGGPGASLFWFTTREQFRTGNPLRAIWRDGDERIVSVA